MSIISALEDKRITGLVTLNAVVDLKSWMSKFDQESWRRDGALFQKNSRTGQDMPLYLQFLKDYEAQLERFDIITRISNEAIPDTLIVYCEDDPVVLPHQAISFKTSADGAKLYRIPSGGHTLGSSHPSQGELSNELRMACEEITVFFKELDWL